MAIVTSGKRYAQAAFQLALERNEVESWLTGLKRIAEMTEEKKLLMALESPRIPFPAKKTLIAQRLGDVNPLVLNLACLLVRKNKLNIAPDIVKQFQKLWDAHNGIERVEVVTAFPLDEEEKETISAHLSRLTGRRVVIEARVDTSLIGGIKVRIGDTVIDGSVLNSLQALRRSLAEAG